MGRRDFFRGALWLFVLPVAVVLRAMLARAGSVPEAGSQTLELPYEPGTGVRFFDRAIVIYGPDGPRVFSSACPHLGCRINHAAGDELVCPCHGSRFDLAGEVRHRPALRGLRPLEHEIDRSKSAIRVRL